MHHVNIKVNTFEAILLRAFSAVQFCQQYQRTAANIMMTGGCLVHMILFYKECHSSYAERVAPFSGNSSNMS